MEVRSSEPQVYRFEFRGSASEYFRIWIVNLVLTIITLGVYSAWAKVRTLRYFYGNTFVNGSNFDYHADPIRILRGRLIFGVFVLVYSLGGIWWPLRIVAALFFVLFPWLLVRGMIFNMKNTSFRGVRFGFEKDYRGSYRTFFKGAAVSLVTLGFLAPLSVFWHHQFRMTRSRFGRTPFSFSGEKWAFWRIYFAAGLIMAGGVVAGAASMGILAMLGRSGGGGTIMAVAGVVLMLVFVYGIGGFGFAYIKAEGLNYILTNTQVGPVKLETRYHTLDLYLVYLGNFFACLLTLGLAYPWARVELAKYRASTTALVARPEDFDGFVAGESQADVGAVGEEMVDFWDIDLGF